MKILFSHQPMLAANVVRCATRSRFSHVDFIYDNSLLFGATATKGVVFHNYHQRLRVCSNAVLMTVPTLLEHDSQMWSWLRAQEGKEYDWKGVLTVFSVNQRNWRDESAWFCSELVAAAFSIVNQHLVDPNVVSRVVPEDLYRLPFEKTLLKGKL